MFIRGKKDVKMPEYNSYGKLKSLVNNMIVLSLKENPYEIVRTKDELDARIMFKKELRHALKNCVLGDRSAKTFVLDYIKDIIAVKLKIGEEELNHIFSFHNRKKLIVKDMFEILLYQYKKRYGTNAFVRLITEFNLDEAKQDANGEIYYEITEQDIEGCFFRAAVNLQYIDKINIAAQRIYQDIKGNGAIDLLLDLHLDGISGGVSGLIPSPDNMIMEHSSKIYSYQSVWVFYKGKSIHLSFTGFESEKELIRVCKNIHRYKNPGQLSEVRGYIVNEMADGSRVAVARPPFSESWVFFIRKFDSIEKKDMENLLTDHNKIYPITLIKWLVKGNQVLAVTGEQGSGKTTLLMSMIQFIRPSYNLRIQEQAFELHLRKVYPRRNIVSFRETAYISGQECLEFQKKTDGMVNILGEVASLKVCLWLIQMGQAASAFSIFTHHAKTTMDLILYFRNALLQMGGFSNEMAAVHQVISVLKFDIHMKKAKDGHRFIDRITEISKTENYYGNQIEKMFQLRELIVFENGSYCVKNIPSDAMQRTILCNLSAKEKQEFLNQIKNWRCYCEN